MSTTDSNAVTGPLAANRDLIEGLRELADWFEQHPGLPAFNGYIATHPHGKHARAEMTALASALGDRAQERCEGDRARIEGKFGPLTVGASTNVAHLGAEPSPRYAPILSREDPDIQPRADHRDYEVIR